MGVMNVKILGGALLVAAGLCGQAQAQAMDQKYWIEVSAYFPKASTTVDVSRPGFPGAVIDMESDLDLDDGQVLPAVYAGARFNNRWVLAGEYYGLDRDGSRTIGRQLEFDGATFPVGVRVDSKMRSDVYRVSLGYAFLQTPTAELGAAIGLHATDFDIELQGEAQVGPVTRQREARRRDFLAPMPTVGVFGTYQPTPKIILTGRADYMSLDMDEYGGSILNAQAAIAYRVTDSIDIGAAYRYVDYSMDIAKTDYTAHLDYDFSGPSVFVRVGFR